MFTYLVIIIALALIFDYINGFHDAANSIATVVSTKVLTPLQAVAWAAFFNFVAYFIFDHGVAETISKIVYQDFVTLNVIFAGIVAAIMWNLLTWWFGIPSSSSHTLIGGFAGAAIAHAYLSHTGDGLPISEIVNMSKIIPTVAFIILAPLLGMIVAFLISVWFLHSFKKGMVFKILSIGIILGAIFLFINVANDPEEGIATLNTEAVTAQKDYAAIAAIYNPAEANKATKKEFDNAKASMMVKNKTLKNAEKLMASKKPYFLKFLLYGHNMKWFLLTFILVSIAAFSIFLSSLNYAKAERWFKRMQLLSSAAFSVGHGGNDSQKVMGIIMAAFVAYDPSKYSLDGMVSWVPLACYTMIALGTLSGGWKIIKTMGTRITKVTPFEGVAAETAGAITLFVTEMLKIPVSTTHTITGSIIGVGATKRLSAVRWGVTVSLLWAWVLTIPVSAVLASIVYFIVSKITG
ncbi:inorganic phosphate transporter [Niabella ginsengisoli]|uniref:Phosphate transporter n=1 Tax=Niabella ginsengisoli TaxID=522298 RepID=A0ABS9SQ51_9BACT|nr:inorganic phosphate transporter [Niabella ginsengisoli]MCH5600244.1 inorganic phosphate transporter [Niabella ginsengisoli]